MDAPVRSGVAQRAARARHRSGAAAAPSRAASATAARTTPARRQTQARIRVTNKALEARQFSTVRLPRRSELPAQRANVDAMNEQDAAVSVSTLTSSNHNATDAVAAPDTTTATRTTTTSVANASARAGNIHHHNSNNKNKTGASAVAAFDPIPHDGMFTVVSASRYWPPPSLEELEQRTGVRVAGHDGFDPYDRRDDDAAARRQHTKVVRGELNHPRGKPRQNVIVRFDDDDDDGDGDAHNARHEQQQQQQQRVSSEQDDDTRAHAKRDGGDRA